MHDADRAEIIQFWHTVEMFSPPAVDKVDPERDVFAVDFGRPLPWEPRHANARRQLRENQAWRHVVYVGIFSMESVFDVLKSRFAPDEASFDARPGGETAVAAFVVSDEGRPLLGSQVLSTCAWATGQVVDPGPGQPGWLTGFDEDLDEFNQRFGQLVAAAPDDVRARSLKNQGHEVGRPLNAGDLAACRDLAATVAGVPEVVPHVEIRVRSEIVSLRNAYTTDGHDFLNSFIADDLASVTEHVRAGRVGDALREYLRPDDELDTAARVDIREDLTAVLEATAPDRVPLGRWPGNPEHPLALSQQLAVDSALAMLNTRPGILAVNGPPGTGKTTMLRDLIAALVVERARRLAELAHPRDAFTDRSRWKTGDYTRVVHGWNPRLTGFEIVVASANNGAVENVTDEIPSADAIDEHWRAMAADLDYFTDIGSALLTKEPDADNPVPAPGDAWALVAARLGNKRNRTRFATTFWYRKPFLAEGEKLPPLADMTPVQRAQLGLQPILQDHEKHKPTRAWADDVATFREALDRATAIGEERQRTYAALRRKKSVQEELRLAEQSLDTARTTATRAKARSEEAQHAAHTWEGERERRLSRRLEHRQFHPNLLERLSTFGRSTREWRQRDRELADAVTEAENALADLHSALPDFSRDVELTARAVAEAEQSLKRCRRELHAVGNALSEARRALGDRFPDDLWWRDRTRREIGALWTDAVWNQARTELFLAALRLHKAFLEHAPQQMRQNLQAAADILSGDAPRDLNPDDALTAWRSLFFVVPVVSTTFASFARLFSHLKQEALGWLLIDEAGQATPQNAVGALWRARRAVVVGDPLQLEPVTTLPFRAEQAIRSDHGVHEQWSASRTSVQGLADRVTRLGTWLPGDDGKIWVGSPLTVHRRCDLPMFDIVNEVAYDGLMINGTSSRHGEKFHEKYPSLPESKWIDVVAAQSDGHWVPEEGRQLDQVLAALTALNFDMSQVMVIAPFRDIAGQVRRRARTHRGLVAGTVHTAQGKQADIVILVLGSDPKSHGARRWAAAKPNLLNVAVSRAKRRLYVIGNRQQWADQRHFDVLAHRLPHSPPR